MKIFEYGFILQIRSEIGYHGAIKWHHILVGVLISFSSEHGITFNQSSVAITEIVHMYFTCSLC
jgi:hypothetical protein